MPPRIVVVGLGPGDPQHLTREAWEVLAEARVLYLRTGQHPVVAHLPAHLELRPLDEGSGPGREAARSVQQIVDCLLAAPEVPVHYGVPGHPLVGEATTRALQQCLGPAQVRIVAGLCFLEPVCTALGLDPLEEGLQLVDALDLAASPGPFVPAPPLDPTRPLLIGRGCDRAAAAGLQAALREHYPDGHPLTVVRAAGRPAQESCWQGTLHDLQRCDLLDALAAVYVPPLPRLAAQREAATLEWICARLRGPAGCPWDREQDHASLRNNLLEECYEVLEALDQGDLVRLREELGDLLMQIYLHAQLAREEGAFVIGDVFAGIAAKLIRRHPHVFGRLEVDGSAEVLRNWEAIKAAERAENGQPDSSLLEGIPATLPALAHAQAIGRRVSRVGFDWTRVEEVWAKVQEEMAELRAAPDAAERAAELGDVLFALVNLARWLDVEAEDALRATNVKFHRRFAWLEEQARASGRPLEEMPMAEMDALWEQAKSVIHIIIPNYNTVDYLVRCLDSLRAQRGAPPLQVHVADNASSDDSVARVRRDYPEVHLYTSDHNGGFAYGVNLALRPLLAQGLTDSDYVLLLNSDTELPPEALAGMVAFMEAHPEAGAAGPRLIMGDGQMDLACRRSFPSPAVAFYRLFGLARIFPRSRRFGRYNLTYLDPAETVEVDAVSGACMLVRGQVVGQVGLLDEAFFFYGEDLDWAYRIKALGWKIYYCPQVQVRHWKRAASRKQPRASRRAFYQAMRIFHRKHYAPHCSWLTNRLIELGITLREGLALAAGAFRRTEDER